MTLAVLVAGVLPGCMASTQGTFYSYKAIPQQMAAAERTNAKTVDLSRLASTSQNSQIFDTGDVVEVSITAGLSEKDMVRFPVRIDERGVANLPVIGAVTLAGQDPAAAEASITAACINRQLYKNPQVTVTMKRQRTNRVTVVGAVETPGVYEIPRGGSDLLGALVAAGGLSEEAGVKVEIRNPAGAAAPQLPPPIAGGAGGDINQAGMNWSTPAQQVGTSRLDSVQVDLISATKSGNGGYPLKDGAIVMVEKRDPEPVHVLGLVRKPNRYEFPIGQNLRVLDAVAIAGGISSPVANRVYVIRKQPDSTQTAIVRLTISDAKRDEAANLLLAPGDVVSVEQTPATIVMSVLQSVGFGIGTSVPFPF